MTPMLSNNYVSCMKATVLLNSRVPYVDLVLLLFLFSFLGSRIVKQIFFVVEKDL